jgi:long-chain acyl-CoA synthetase
MIVDRQPSTDKPWLRYYRRSIQGTPSPEMSLYSFLFENNKSNMDSVALNYYGKKTTYRELFEKVDVVASALQNSGVRKGDIVSLCALNIPEFIYLLSS